MNTKQDCLDFLSLNLSKTSNWRRIQAQRFPDDTRNERAAPRLSALATQATDISDDAWNQISPHFDPKDRGWCEAVSFASRGVGFRVTARTFDEYVQTVIDALAVAV